MCQARRDAAISIFLFEIKALKEISGAPAAAFLGSG
jgi:hypothetical protein